MAQETQTGVCINSEGDQPWDFFGRNDAKAETPVLWPPHEKSWLIGKDSDAGGNWGQEEKGMTEDEMAGWHHWLDGCESEWTLGVVYIHSLSELWEFTLGQGGLACCSWWSCKESGTTERLNWTERDGMGRDLRQRFKMEGIFVYLWLIHIEVWQKTTKFCKAINLQ